VNKLSTADRARIVQLARLQTFNPQAREAICLALGFAEVFGPKGGEDALRQHPAYACLCEAECAAGSPLCNTCRGGEATVIVAEILETADAR
jgi:hypothetical protein